MHRYSFSSKPLQAIWWNHLPGQTTVATTKPHTTTLSLLTFHSIQTERNPPSLLYCHPFNDRPPPRTMNTQNNNHPQRPSGIIRRTFGNDISNRNSKTPHDAANKKPAAEKRITRSMSRTLAAQRNAAASAATANGNGNGNNDAPMDSLASLPRPGKQPAIAPPRQVSLIGAFGGTARSGSTSSFATTPPLGYQYTGTLDDIDARDADDPLKVTAYVQDMYALHKEREVVTSVRPGYMERQPHINGRMRAILVDWLVEVHQKFRLVPETLYLCTNLIDRYLEKAVVDRSNLQLVGVTALLIASKYEEIYYPELSEMAHVCDGAYSPHEILDMEETILKALNYQITIPSAHTFLIRYLKAGHADKKMVQLACFILDGTLQNYDLLQYRPSQLASAAVMIARKNAHRNLWSPTLLKYTEYRQEDVLPVARAVLEAWSTVSSGDWLRAVSKKYSSIRFGEVAQITLPAPSDL